MGVRKVWQDSTWSRNRPTRSGWYWIAWGPHQGNRRPLYFPPRRIRSLGMQATVRTHPDAILFWRAEQVAWWGPEVEKP